MLEFVLSLSRSRKRVILMGLDMLAGVWALLATWLLTLNRLPFWVELPVFLWLGVVIVLAAGGMSFALGLHRIKLNAYDLHGAAQNFLVAAVVAIVAALAARVVSSPLFPDAFILLGMSYAIISVGQRVALRSYVMWLIARNRQRKRVLLYGAGQTGQQLASALITDDAFVAVGFIDDNPALHGLVIAGLRVYSPLQIAQLVEEKEVERIVIAMPSASPATQREIERRLNQFGVEVLSVPSFADLVLEGVRPRNKEKLDVQALLGRSAVDTSLPAFNGAYRGRRVLVTGAGGSIGTELCRQLLACAPEKLVMLDHSELALYNIDRELAAQESTCTRVPVLGSVCEPGLVRQTLKRHGIEVVLHAAAYKHLPMVEENALEGLRNNVLGTQVVAEESARAGVERFILVSSDKAVRPSSIMGASKRMAELVVQDKAARHSRTRFSMVRFGNVLGSSGSVIPLFEEQIARGGPVTLTDRNMTRYFMTTKEAVSLVLLAGTYARGGEVFVLNMGKPVRIERLARELIRNAGYTVRDDRNPDGDIEIKVTGIRPGEKLHEELLIGSDMLTTPHPKILRAQEDSLSVSEMDTLLSELGVAIEEADEGRARAVISRWVEPQPDAKVTRLSAVGK